MEALCFFAGETMTQCTTLPLLLHQQTVALFSGGMCRARYLCSLCSSQSLSRETTGHFKERREKNRLFCCAATLPQHNTLFKIVSREAHFKSRILSIKALCVGEFTCNIRCMLQSIASGGQILLARESVSLAFWKVPELSKVTKKY